MVQPRELRITVAEAGEDVSAVLLRPQDARFLYILAHGAGAGMRHPFLERLAQGLARLGGATLRYQLPYMERKRRRPDPPALAVAAVRAAVVAATREARDLPLVAGGKSFGGRMTSTAQAAQPLPGVRGLAFVGFPLHPPAKPATTRADHLAAVEIPMLFLQGDRDEFAELVLLRQVVRQLGRRATLHLVKSGDHSFNVPKSSGRSGEDVMRDLCDTVATWAAGLTGSVRT